MKALFLGSLLKRKRAKKALFLIYVVKWDMVRARKGHLACKEPKRSSVGVISRPRPQGARGEGKKLTCPKFMCSYLVHLWAAMALREAATTKDHLVHLFFID
jgi:hypothetical protein